jgi:hypothetical protein
MRKFALVALFAFAAAWIARPFAWAADPVAPQGAVPKVASKPAPLGPAAPTLDAAAEEIDVASETIGTLSGAYLNQAYLSIGILGDAVGAEVYEPAEARELLNVHLELAEQAEAQLTALAKSPDLETSDAEGVLQLAKIAGLIRQQGLVLQAVWAGDESRIPIWEKLRDDTANEIEKFFGEDEATN